MNAISEIETKLIVIKTPQLKLFGHYFFKNRCSPSHHILSFVIFQYSHYTRMGELCCAPSSPTQTFCLYFLQACPDLISTVVVTVET